MQTAQEEISGTPNSLDGVSATARRLGITSQAVNDIYRKYGNTMQGRAVCGLLGTTPEALKDDAEKILGGGERPPQTRPSAQKSTSRFPRLK